MILQEAKWMFQYVGYEVVTWSKFSEVEMSHSPLSKIILQPTYI